MLGWRPELAWDVGFQLSFAGTVAIIVLTPDVERRLHWMPGWVREPFAVTCAAQVGTLPFMATSFRVVSPIAPVANAAVSPGTVPAQPRVGRRRDEEVLIALLHVAARAVAHEERLAAVLLSREILEILAR